MVKSRISGPFGSEDSMHNLKISQFDIGERWGHQEMQADMMSRDMNYAESSLPCSATNGITCSGLR